MDWLGDYLVLYLAAKLVAVTKLGIELGFVLAVAVFVVLLSRKGRPTRVMTALRVLMTARIWRSPSAMLDYKYAVFNIVFFPVLLGVTILGTHQVAEFLGTFLPKPRGQPGLLTETQARIAVTIVLFLALEFAYWFDHFLSHRVPMLWAFHKVHHSAEVLTPLTNFRVHPFDTLVYYNIKAVITGAVYCVAIFALDCKPLSTWEGMLMVVYMWTYGNLQHTELWIVFPGWLGRIFFSPAHHQIHHSKAAIHHNTNFGMSLLLFDWMFGTLHQPTREKQHLEFGIAHDAHHHQFGASLTEPVIRAYRRFVPKRRPPATAPAHTSSVAATPIEEHAPTPSFV